MIADNVLRTEIDVQRLLDARFGAWRLMVVGMQSRHLSPHVWGPWRN